jgi:branched-chain amino acid transport system substrate-binding protein
MKNFRKKIMGPTFLVIGIALISGCKGNRSKKGEETLKIGVVVPLTGNSGILGEFTLKGVQLAVDMQNEKGGLLNRKIELDIRDSKADPVEGVAVVREMLKQEEKPFLVYSIVSGVSQAIKTETEAGGIVLMSAVGTDRFLEESKYTIRNYISAESNGKVISQFLKDSLNVADLTVFYSDSEYGRSMKDAVARYCKELKMMVVTEPYDENLNDYTSLIASKLNMETGCVYVIGVGTGMGTIFRQIRESGYDGKMIGDPLMAYPDVEEAAGNALDGVTYLDLAFEPESVDPAGKAFVEGFEKKFNVLPRNYSAISYEGVNLMFSLVEQAGSADPGVLIKLLSETTGFEGSIMPFTVTDRYIHYEYVFKTRK